MKKTLLGIFVFFLIGTYAQAQDVIESNIEIKKIAHPGVLANYNFSKEIVDKVLKDKLDKAGLENKTKKSGFTVYEGTLWQGLADSKMDVYTKVTGSKNKSAVYVLFSKGYDNFINSTTDPDVYNKAKNFLKNLEKDIENYQQLLIQQQKEEELAKEQKKYEKMMKEKEKRDKEIQKQNEKLLEKQQSLEQVKQSSVTP